MTALIRYFVPFWIIGGCILFLTRNLGYDWLHNDFSHSQIPMTSNDTYLWRESAPGFRALSINDSRVALACSFDFPNVSTQEIHYSMKLSRDFEPMSPFAIVFSETFPFEDKDEIRVKYDIKAINPSASDMISYSIDAIGYNATRGVFPLNNPGNFSLVSEPSNVPIEELYLSRKGHLLIVSVDMKCSYKLDIQFTIIKRRYEISTGKNICPDGSLVSTEAVPPFYFVISTPTEKTLANRVVGVTRKFVFTYTILHWLYALLAFLVGGSLFAMVNPWTWVLCCVEIGRKSKKGGNVRDSIVIIDMAAVQGSQKV